MYPRYIRIAVLNSSILFNVAAQYLTKKYYKRQKNSFSFIHKYFIEKRIPMKNLILPYPYWIFDIQPFYADNSSYLPQYN